MCPAEPRHPPIPPFRSEMLLSTWDWPHYPCRLGILFADLNIRPSAPATSCTPSASVYTYFLSLLADPLGFEDPPLVFPVAEQTRRWLYMPPATAYFLRSTCPALSSATSSQPPAPACPTPCTTDTATTLDSMDGPPTCTTSILLGSSVLSSWPLPGARVSCCSPQVPCVSCS
jgi:hypothetical protein